MKYFMKLKKQVLCPLKIVTPKIVTENVTIMSGHSKYA